MPEGHTLHRLARDLTAQFVGAPVAVTSPQGRFADAAARIDGRVLDQVRAHGKHLFAAFDDDVVHVHLGLYGKFELGRGGPPPPRGALRMRWVSAEGWADLRGATACELLTPAEAMAVVARLGPDPLARRPNGAAAYARIARSRAPIATLLMDQTVLAGVGNVYRAELLYRHRVPPLRLGRDLDISTWQAMWADLRALMLAGVRTGRIVTTRPEHRARPRGSPTTDDAFYVYRRTGEPCRVCGTPIAMQILATRKLYWCPTCQRG